MSMPIQQQKPPPEILPTGRLRLGGFTPLVEVAADGSRLRPYPDRTLILPESLEFLHTLVVGRPGSGKTTRAIERFIEAGLNDRERTLVVVDPGKALQSTVHGLATALRPGGRVFHFDWLDTDHSCRWNLLSQVTDRSSASQVSKLLGSMTPIGREETRYFHQRAERLLAHILLALRERDGEPTLRALRRIIDDGHGALLTLAGCGNSVVLANFVQELRDYASSNTMTTFSELESWFSFAEDDRIVQTTSSSAFDPMVLEEEPCVVYVGVDEPSIETLRPILNLFLKSVLDSLVAAGTRNGGPLRRTVSVIVDECPRLGRIIGLEALANTLRKRRVGLTFALQSSEQIQQVYAEGAGSFMAAFNNNIFVPPVSDADATRASSLSGMMQAQAATTEADGITPAFLSPVLRPVLTPHEVSNPPAHPQLGPLMTFKLKDVPMFQGYLRASWEIASIREAKASWHTGLLPVLATAKAAHTDDATLPSVKLTEEEAEKLVPGLVAGVRELVTRTTARWPAGILGQLYDGLLEGLPDQVFGSLQQMPVADLRKMFRQLGKQRLDSSHAEARARAWWRAIEECKPEDFHRVVRFALALVARRTTLQKFFEECLGCPVDDFQAMLHHFDFQRRLAVVDPSIPDRPGAPSATPEDIRCLDAIMGFPSEIIAEFERRRLHPQPLDSAENDPEGCPPDQ